MSASKYLLITIKNCKTAVVITPVGVAAVAADGVTDGKLGIKKFVTGQGNNDAAYVKKEV